MLRLLLSLLLCLNFQFGFAQKNKLPEEFVYVREMIPDVVLDMRYSGSKNFIGSPVEGYLKPVAILSKPAAAALYKVQQDLKNKGFCIKIFDAYRPQKAVDQFIAWARDVEDTVMKQEYYPKVDKKNLFNYGYISTRSGHSRGSTIDLTLTDANTGEELDMGSNYDFFGEISHHNTSAITPEQKQNRELLKRVMSKYGFHAYPQEWWHYSLRPEPYPETYFDFDVR